MKKLLVLLFLGILSSGVYGATINASSCSSTDVQSAITSSSNGDTVQVPGGTATWNTTVTVSSSHQITLNGGGCLVTFGESGLLTVTAGTSNNTRVTNFSFTGSGTNGNDVMEFHTVTSPASLAFRFDHNTCGCGSPSAPSTMVGVYQNGPGLIDDNSFTCAHGADEMLHILGTGASDDSSWWDTVTPGSANAIYIETNTFTENGSFASAWEGYYGSRVVGRHNTFTNSQIDAHGSGGIGQRWYEYYNNDFPDQAGICLRAGSGVVFSNTNTGAIRMTQEDGSYPAEWQVGQGQEVVHNTPTNCSTGGPPGCYYSYVWSDVTPQLNTTTGCAVGLANLIQFQRDVYSVGGHGVTTGTFGSIPGTCTPYQGYFATDQGTLYQCTATNTWTAYYTPYTYPYPLAPLPAGLFTVASTGCPQNHCTNHGTNLSTVVPFTTPPPGVVFFDSSKTGTGLQLGATSDGTYIAMGYGASPTVVFYLATLSGGAPVIQTLWNSSSQSPQLGTGACTPIIGTDATSGAVRVIAADPYNIISYNLAGGIDWSTPIPTGSGQPGGSQTCVSLTVGASGEILYTSLNRPLASFRSDTGAYLGRLLPGLSGGNFYVTNNSAAVDGDNFYLVVNGTGSNGSGPQYTDGRVIKITCSLTSACTLAETSASFLAPSGASPTVVSVSGTLQIYTDSGGRSPGGTFTGPSSWQCFADSGGSLTACSNFPILTSTLATTPGPVIASMALDPNASSPCLWTYVQGNDKMWCLDVSSGAADATITTGAGFIPGQGSVVDGSDDTLSSTSANHTIMCRSFNVIGNPPGNAYVGCMDVTASPATLLWYYQVGSGGASQNLAGGQFPAFSWSNGLEGIAFTGTKIGGTFLGTFGWSLQINGYLNLTAGQITFP